MNVIIFFKNSIAEWFGGVRSQRKEFLQALLCDNVDEMNQLMLKIIENVFAYFDIGGEEPEAFYHAFVLGMIVDLEGKYTIRSNRESEYGRYDVCLFPNSLYDHGIAIEFKTMKKSGEKNLEETCTSAIRQIKEKKYCNELLAHNVVVDNIYVYGFAFKGKEVLICGGLEANMACA